jgi:hypothetical protein
MYATVPERGSRAGEVLGGIFHGGAWRSRNRRRESGHEKFGESEVGYCASESAMHGSDYVVSLLPEQILTFNPLP